MSKDKFEWDDDKVVQFTNWSLNQSPTFQGRYADIEQFKSMFQPKEDKPEWEGSKEWEIIECSGQSGVHIYHGSEILQFNGTPCYKLGCKIHSVKRNSDGEVFAVGDAFYNDSAGYYSEHIIKKFVISGRHIEVRYTDDLPQMYYLKDIKKLKPKEELKEPERKIEVINMSEPTYNMMSGDDYGYFEIGINLTPKELKPKLPLIKKAIELILNV